MNTDTPTSPFECKNCGYKPTAQEVLVHHGDCAKCGDTVIIYTVDAAECITDLREELAATNLIVETLQSAQKNSHERMTNAEVECERLKRLLNPAPDVPVQSPQTPVT